MVDELVCFLVLEGGLLYVRRKEEEGYCFVRGQGFIQTGV